MGFSGRARAIRIQLISKHGPKCCYCGVKTVMPVTGQSVLKPNNSTVEHIYHAFDIRRLLSDNSKQYLRICCYKCNQKMDWEMKKAIYGGPYNFKETDYAGIIIKLAEYHLSVSM